MPMAAGFLRWNAAENSARQPKLWFSKIRGRLFLYGKEAVGRNHVFPLLACTSNRL
jgi:hypothetical protein